MRTWNDKLFLDAIPGRKKLNRPRGDFGQWQQEMAENRIRTVVCLAPEKQIADESPEYSRWRSEQFELIDIPVEDFCAPEPFLAARFWKAAGDVAVRIQNGARVK